MKTLEQIIEYEKQHRVEGGMFGINACKETILWERDVLHKSLFTQLEEYYIKANHDIFFNKAMILACWELINDLYSPNAQ